jgi:hypothetical protein
MLNMKRDQRRNPFSSLANRTIEDLPVRHLQVGGHDESETKGHSATGSISSESPYLWGSEWLNFARIFLGGYFASHESH